MEASSPAGSQAAEMSDDAGDDDFFTRKRKQPTRLVQLDEFLSGQSSETVGFGWLQLQHGHWWIDCSSQPTLPCQPALRMSAFSVQLATFSRHWGPASEMSISKISCCWGLTSPFLGDNFFIVVWTCVHCCALSYFVNFCAPWYFDYMLPRRSQHIRWNWF